MLLGRGYPCWTGTVAPCSSAVCWGVYPSAREGEGLHAEAIVTGLPYGNGPVDAIVVGASLGGPVALKHFVSGLPRDLAAPVAICQHIAPSMVAVLAEQLDKVAALKVVVARDRERLEAGRVYVAPGGRHMRLARGNDGGVVQLDRDFADSLHVPSIDVLFSSAAMAFGSCTVAVLLTGMGSDGALGMHAVRTAGGYTVAESEQTAASYSMPRAAVELGAVAVQYPIERIAAAVATRVGSGNRG